MKSVTGYRTSTLIPSFPKSHFDCLWIRRGLDHLQNLITVFLASLWENREAPQFRAWIVRMTGPQLA